MNPVIFLFLAVVNGLMVVPNLFIFIKEKRRDSLIACTLNGLAFILCLFTFVLKVVT